MKILSSLVAVALSANACVDINTAPKEELEKIIQIGESRAQQIIKLREERLFSSLNELGHVIGLGESRISAIKKQGLACISAQQTSQLTTTTQLATVSQQVPREKSPNATAIFVSLVIAIFSGFAILFLKKKIKT